ncbi:hypothetical protein [Aeromicrobium sp.]|uniref:hypothetical protein n=1 Tax=Aeromicrobium sp. TaxID=1871063 RepID=UPI001988FB54|nr:hypothetical protein [Aeromicrobium sp.]MBC7630326.1 hypothetical protein [Aeromicrobium sp.]
MWDSVPWFVGGGAQHTPEVARLLAFTALGGAEGIINATDLKVYARPTPGSTVRVMPGGCSILSRASGGAQQAYTARNPSEDIVSIAATTSGASRTDLIVARVEDPFMAGEPWAAPATPTTGPYIFTRVISNVPAGTTSVAELNLGYTAIPLARINIPASTATITDSMITDLRTVARPRTSRTHSRQDCAPAPNDLSSYSFVVFPITPAQYIAVPSWATAAVIRVDVTGLFTANTAVGGVIRANFGSVATAETYFNEQVPDGSRKSYVASSTVPIPPNMRGNVNGINVQAKLIDGTGPMRADIGTQILYDVEFLEKAA